MKVIMSVLSSRGENEGVCVSLCACGGSGGVPVPLLCPNEPKHSQNSCFSFPSSLLHVVQQGVSDFESLIQNFRKSSAPPSRELPHAPPPFHPPPLLSPGVTNWRVMNRSGPPIRQVPGLEAALALCGSFSSSALWVVVL